MTHGRCRKRPKAGFTLMEMLVICAILGILALISVPMLMQAVPGFRVKTEASSAATIMRQARLKAASTQRPTRVVISCDAHNNNARQPCVITMQTAQYKNGAFTNWLSAANTRHAMNNRVAVIRSAQSGATGPAGVFWAVFMPSSRVVSSHDPMIMVFVSEDRQRNPASVSWEVDINSGSGRTTLVRRH